MAALGRTQGSHSNCPTATVCAMSQNQAPSARVNLKESLSQSLRLSLRVSMMETGPPPATQITPWLQHSLIPRFPGSVGSSCSTESQRVSSNPSSMSLFACSWFTLCLRSSMPCAYFAGSLLRDRNRAASDSTDFSGTAMSSTRSRTLVMLLTNQDLSSWQRLAEFLHSLSQNSFIAKQGPSSLKFLLLRRVSRYSTSRWQMDWRATRESSDQSYPGTDCESAYSQLSTLSPARRLSRLAIPWQRFTRRWSSRAWIFATRSRVSEWIWLQSQYCSSLESPQRQSTECIWERTMEDCRAAAWREEGPQVSWGASQRMWSSKHCAQRWSARERQRWVRGRCWQRMKVMIYQWDEMDRWSYRRLDGRSLFNLSWAKIRL